MPTFAYVAVDPANTVTALIVSATAPSLPGGGEWFNVTNVNPRPGLGWTYDGTAFSEPAALVNRDTLMNKAQAAVNANVTFLGLGAPTNAEIVGQTQLLTKECTALIRLVLGLLDSTQGA